MRTRERHVVDTLSLDLEDAHELDEHGMAEHDDGIGDSRSGHASRVDGNKQQARTSMRAGVFIEVRVTREGRRHAFRRDIYSCV